MTRSRMSAVLAVLHLAIAGTLPAMAVPYLQGPTSRGIEASAIGSVLHVRQSQQERQEFIREVQEGLQALGLYRGAIDGIGGAALEQGLDEFMRRAGYRGEFDKNARNHLWWAAHIGRARPVSLEFAVHEASALATSSDHLRKADQAKSDGRRTEAEALYRRALRARERILGNEHPSTLVLLDNLAASIYEQSRATEAEALHRRAFDGLERTLGQEHPATLESLLNLAGNLRFQGRHAEAEALYRRAFETRERTLGPEHLDTLASLSSLAGSLHHQGRYTEAEALYQRAFDGLERTLGQEHPATLQSLLNLARNLGFQGRHTEAQTLRRQVLEIRDRTLGPEHPRTIHLLDEMAYEANNNRILSDAETLYQRSLEAKERILGPDHADTLHSLYWLASTLRDQGRYAEAETLYRRYFEARERTLGPQHLDTLTALSILAGTLGDQGRYAEAEALYRRVLQARERILGSEHPDTLTSLSILARNLMNQGRYVEAETLYRRVYEAHERTLGPEESITLTSLNNLASTLRDQGRYAEAEALYQRSARLNGYEYDTTLYGLGAFSRSLRNQGRHAEAEALDRRVLEALERQLGPEHRYTLGVVLYLANNLRDQGRNADAEALYRRALEAFELIPGPEHPSTLLARDSLARTYLELDIDQALSTWEAGFPALPGYLMTTDRLEVGGGDLGPRTPLDLELYLATLAELEINPQAKAARSFPVQGFLTYSTLDIALGDQAARGAIADEAAGRALRDLQDAREAIDQSRRAYLASFEDESRAAARDGLAQAMREAESRLTDVTARIERDFPALAELELPQPLTADEAQALLRPDEGMLAFAATDETLYAWFATKETITWKPIPISRADLAEAVAGLRAAVDMEQKPPDYRVDDACALRARHAALADRPFDLCASQALYDMLLGDFDLAGVSELIVVADGPLQQLPFAMLVSDRHDNDTPRWLIEDRAVTTLPTTSSLRALRRDAPVSASDDRRPFLGFAPVTFDGPGDGSPLRSTLIDLPATEDEVRFLAGVLGAGPDGAVLGDAATEAKVKSTRLDRYRVVSFATHGLLSREAEEVTDGAVRDPALVLRAGGGEDGLLTASEVATLRLDADWVLLSGCNTAGGGGEDARGLSGLARAFFFAGARSLLVSHWSVDDNAAMELMIETVSRDVDNEAYGRAQALRQAQLTVMSNPDHAHPLFWAPFDLVGESR